MASSNGSRSRKLVTLPLKQKIELIQCVESGGKKKKEIADDFGIAPNTLSTILWDKDMYRKLFYEGKTNVNKQRARAATHEDVDKALLVWFTSARSDNVPLSGPTVYDHSSAPPELAPWGAYSGTNTSYFRS